MMCPTRMSVLTLIVAVLLGLGGCAAGSGASGLNLSPSGYVFLSVDSTAYSPVVYTRVSAPSDSLCTNESIGRPESLYINSYDCFQALAFYSREKGYLYRVRTPSDSLIYVLSRAAIAPGHDLPAPDTLVPPPPGPGYERIRLGATYRDLDLRPARVQVQELVTDPAVFQGRPYRLIISDEVSAEYAARYRPLVSDALHGPYVRTGLRAETARP